MGKSYGFVEISGVVAAMDALDIMLKTSEVELASWERKMGGRLVTIIVQGDVASVEQAVEAARERAIKKPVAAVVIARPHEEIVRMVELSASRWKKQQPQQPAGGKTDGTGERETGSAAAGKENGEGGEH